MTVEFTADFKRTIEQRLAHLYKPDDKAQALDALLSMLAKYQAIFPNKVQGHRWNEEDMILITYGDSVCGLENKPLQSLYKFWLEYLDKVLPCIHILPFYPFSSDDGFSVIDYKMVNHELGSWHDIMQISDNVDLMFDYVLNHISRESLWFVDYVSGNKPYTDYFIQLPPETDTHLVTRPRNTPLLAPIHTRQGLKYVWATFSEDQIDLNYANWRVLIAMIDVFLFYISKGARFVRLDAVAFLWKQLGTNCIHLPETHEVVKLLRDIIDEIAPWVVIITETNVPHSENLSYFGAGDEAHMIYQFALPPLVLFTMHRGNSETLTSWCMSLNPPPDNCTFLNFTASHDGVGLRALENILPPHELESLVDSMHQFGGFVSMKSNSDGTESPYEINISYYDAMLGTRTGPDQWQQQRFLCSQTLMISLQGIPAIYIHSLLATPNDLEGVESTGRLRSINRKKWQAVDLDKHLSSRDGLVFKEYKRRLQLRKMQKAFSPDAEQKVFDISSQLFVIRRSHKQQTLFAIYNVTSRIVELDLQKLYHGNDATLIDVLSGTQYQADKTIKIEPYQALWLS
ncbi:alpha-amylase [Saccharobesus litoralis]|uniref:Alpha-amylase n=1 Tax=Saccharobesus litoralis TaxID=2172099 RepID=A0A2S0VS21_9ALTE|nr:sugar phosphorylase [Saccharobesus litoralis]AWB66900.1 alpha-amylase [Saccharobesus litoralis]